MNIFGEGFPEEIVSQVANRQKVYGSGYSNGVSRTPEEILYLNARTSWCKLSSGVNVDDINNINNPTIKIMGLSNNDLAKHFILFNGTADSSGKGLRGGINLDNILLGGDNAYGIGGNEFGIRPMMGIISANINHENRGSLRRAEVKIKAFNKAQFEIIDILYLRLGFYVLLEWGHSMTINKDGQIETNPQDYSLSSDFVNGTLDGKEASYEDFLKKIHDQRLASGGNYDAMFAKVTNFHWSFLPDGSYDITVNLSSVGDIIESLKINVLLQNADTSLAKVAKANSDREDALSEGDAGDIIDAFYTANTIGTFFFILKYFLDKASSESGSEIKTLSLNNPATVAQTQTTINNNKNMVKFDISKFTPDMVDAMTNQFVDSAMSGGGVTDVDRYYIRLGTFLQFLQEYLVPKIVTSNNAPMLRFDFDEATNIMNLHPMQVAVDPRICMVNRVIELQSKNFTYGSINQKNPFHNRSIVIPDKPYDLYANVMNIYVDMAYILAKINELKDDKGNLSLIDLLQNLMSGVNEGLGGINDFDVFVDETINTVKIVDKNPLKNLDQVITIINAIPTTAPNNGGRSLSTTPAFFDLYGYYEGTGNASFIKEFNFTTELTPEFSTMITVGAAANGTVVGENDTALSRINKGLSDRYKKEVSNTINQTTPSSQDQLKASQDRKKEYDELVKNYLPFLKRVSNSAVSNQSATEIEATVEQIDSNKNSLSAIIQKKLEYDNALKTYTNSTTVIDKALEYPGFIPFNLSLTMDGLSGMKINQQFNIETRFLPSNYPETVRFLIKNLTHTIEGNRWWTKLESYCIAKHDLSSNNNPIPNAPVAQSNDANNPNNTNKGGACVDPYTDKYLDRGWIGKKQPFQRTIIDPSVEGPKLKAKYGKPLAQAMLAVMKIEQNNKGFNWNLGGFDITAGGWRFDPKYHNGYVVAKEGGSHLCKAFISFIDFQAFAEYKSNAFKRKGFDQADTADKFANLWYTKWNGSGYPDPNIIQGSRTIKPANISLADWDKKMLRDAASVWNDVGKYL